MGYIDHPEYGSGIQLVEDDGFIIEGSYADVTNNNFSGLGEVLATGLGVGGGGISLDVENTWTEPQNFNSGITTSGNVLYQDTFWEELHISSSAVISGVSQSPFFLQALLEKDLSTLIVLTHIVFFQTFFSG